MKTLVIAYRYPLPENGGDRIRTMNFVKFFEKKGRVDIVYYEPLDKGVETGLPFDMSLHVDVYNDQVNKNRLMYLYDKIKYTKPWALGDFTENGIRKIVQVIEDGNYDYILCRNVLTALPLFYLSERSKKKVIIDIDDIMTKELHSSAGSRNTELSRLTKFKKMIDFEFYRLFQIKGARLGKSLICSEKDRNQLSRHMQAQKIFVVPNIANKFEIPDEYAKSGHCNIGTILFVGHLSYTPNVQGIIWFIEEVFSKMLHSGEQFRLVIIGKNPTPQLTDVCKEFSQIELVDTPPDVLPFYDKCGVVIVPLLAGGGTRIKILEAGYALRPIISTRIGAYGLNLTEYEHILSFDDYHSFVEKLNWLKENNNYKQITNNMNNYVTDNYSRATFENAMESVLIS